MYARNGMYAWNVCVECMRMYMNANGMYAWNVCVECMRGMYAICMHCYAKTAGITFNCPVGLIKKYISLLPTKSTIEKHVQTQTF